jgi:hypothetical protein
LDVPSGTVWPPFLSYCISMFRIVLQPEEQTLLHIIKEGLYPTGLVPCPMLLKLVALRMLKCDKHGITRLTELAEAALARMQGKVH